MKWLRSRKNSYLVLFNISVIGIVIAVAVSISLLFFYQMYRSNMESAIDGLQNDLTQIDQLLSENIESIFNVTNLLADDAQLGKAVEQYYSASLNDSVQGKRMIDYILRNALGLSTDAENISLLCGEHMLQVDRYSLEANIDLDGMKAQDWYGQLLRDEIPFAFGLNSDYVSRSGGETQFYFCAAKFKSKFYQNRRDESRIVVVTFRLDGRTARMAEMAAQYGINLLLYDGDSGRTLCMAGADPEFLACAEVWRQGPILPDSFADLERDFITIRRTNALSGWELCGFARRAAFAAMAYPVQGGLVALLLLLVSLDILFSVAVVRNISKPLERVVKGMVDIGNQDFYALGDRASYWEIDQLVTTFNQMSRRIQELISGIAREEQEKRKMEFRMLENQINPHFIYNTLDATRWLALVNNDKAVAAMIASLSRLLRVSLSGGRAMIPVRQEILLTREYANIMVLRNNASIEFQYDVAPDVEELLTLKMVLQPLVENCFVHAFPEGCPDARVAIRCFRREDTLVMTVTDNGSGISGRPSDAPRDPLLSGIGIHNIEERLRLWYGDSFGLTVAAPPGGGTTITITQPVSPAEGGTEDDHSPVG